MYNPRWLRSPSLRKLKCHPIVLVTLAVVVIVATLVALGCRKAVAQDHSVYLPLVFKADTVILPPGQVSTQQFQQGNIFTSACLEVVEKVYPGDRWWEGADDGSKSPESALKAVILALRHKDRAALLKTLDPATTQVDPHLKLKGHAVGPAELAELALQQFETLELVAVPRAYEFDDQVVFLARVRPEQSVSFLPLHFTREPNGSFGFLLGGSKKLTYDIVQDWFQLYIRVGAAQEITNQGIVQPKALSARRTRFPCSAQWA